ncbi:unnamed protein product [Blepharisma stoltei]|uniref:CID domain-containing protein n=1 Tax=Blepharisma stoltei TaxID=1481888 RepID=A0AAU9JQ94_9CILI|nr:unnamed protein product [Blepharisma stoltei]
MEVAEAQFLESLHSLTTAKDKIFEISSVMISHQTTAAKHLVSVWLREFRNFSEEKKKLALLFVMNDVLMKSSRETRSEEYLKEFTAIIDDILQAMIEYKSEQFVEEFRKIVMVWEKPGTSIFVPAFTAQLKNKIQETINSIQDEKSGASVIQEFEITRKLADLESKHEENLELAKQLDGLCKVMDQSSLAWNTADIKSQLLEYRGKCELELIERSNLLMMLSRTLEEEYQKYISFPERLEALNNQ